MCVCVYVCIYVYIYIYVCMYIYTYMCNVDLQLTDLVSVNRRDNELVNIC